MPEPVYNVLFLCTGNSARSYGITSPTRSSRAGV